ncbi:actinorhodin polyketide synthase [Spongiactinospora rosea]|uniref:Actinorhodin polyketide synthase n=2 Tax=Spongiactinospora rosea TaxID=2248750 RepID=A0A366M3M2_9ACTN|nr:actinorhodin polyketide synthase [Spongiactinospora rosea]
MREMTVETLVRLLRESAGEDEGVRLDGDILDVTFESLGYDSLALFNTVGAIEREYDLEIPEETAGGAKTPADLLNVVNQALTGTS